MLGWLDSPSKELKKLPELIKIKDSLKKLNFENLVLLGMGGSSIGPKVFKAILAPENSNFYILDSTHPSDIKKIEDKINIAKTLFIVASKSGSTLEPNILYKYFWHELEKLNILEPAKHFMAITDPITHLEQESQEQGFLQGPFGDPDIGGRYSALSAFGLMPALLMNINTKELLERALVMSNNCRDENININLGAQLGLFLAEQVNNNRDQLVFYFSPKIKSFGWWLEQLIAESLGKNNSGIVPIINPDTYINSHKDVSCFISLGDEEITNNINTPVINIKINNILELGAEMFRWQFATSIIGALLELNPFDQPDVEKSKIQAKNILEEMRKDPNKKLHNNIFDQKEFIEFLTQAQNKSYLAILSYLEDNQENNIYLKNLSNALAYKLKLPVLIQRGPSYLHSTGQLFKGGKNDGCFLLLSNSYPVDLPSFYAGLGFKDINISQALGDNQAMKDAHRQIMHIALKDAPVGFKEIMALIKH